MMIKIFLSLLLGLTLCNANQSPQINFTKKYTMNYTKDTQCLVRHLKVYKEPKWVAKIELSNGKNIFFSSPKSMFEFYFRPGKWYSLGVRKESDMKDIVVTDYTTMKLIDAKKAYYVYGSRAISPGGDDLPAFQTYTLAQQFAKKYNGKRIMKFTEISNALIRLIDGRI